MNGITKTVAQVVSQVTFNDFPEAVVKKTKWIILDSIGCALGSYHVDRTRIDVELVNDLGGKPQASIIGNVRTSYGLAAFANGDLINSLDYDLIGPLTAHICPQVVASSLAIAEKVNASGKDLITAIALGLEIAGRFGSSLSGLRIPKEEPPYFEESQRFSYSLSIFGAVAGVCKLLGFDNVRIANALGIGGASTPVPAGIKWEHIEGPAVMVKYGCWIGWVAQLAVMAGLAAEKGFTGDDTILDGDLGFWKIFGSPFFKGELLTKGLGKTWHTEEAYFKSYPCCYMNHAFIGGVEKIIRENGIYSGDIQTIVIKGDPLMLTENRLGKEVNCYSDTQFLIPYSAAIAAFPEYRPGPAWQSPVTFSDPKIIDLMKKVRVEIHPEASKLSQAAFKKGGMPLFWNVIVEIKAKNKTFSTNVEFPKGHTGNPMTEDELKWKFRNNASYSLLTTDKAEKAMETILTLEKITNVSELTRLLTIG